VKSALADGLLPPAGSAAGRAAMWRAFAAAGSPESFCRAWLALLCSRIPGADAGVVAMYGSGGESAGPVPVAHWPESRTDAGLFSGVIERAVELSQGVVLPRGPRGDAGGGRFQVAYPVKVDGKLRALVAIELEAGAGGEIDLAVEELQWGGVWLETLLRRGQGKGEGAAAERVGFVLNLFASLLDQPDFDRCASVCVTELASFLECDRVSLGAIRGGKVQVAALSHCAQFDRRSNLARAIEEAMQESIDQHRPISFPAGQDEGGPALPAITQSHARLAHGFESASVRTVPLVSAGRAVGALTLERRGARTLTPAARGTVDSIAALLGPVLDLQLARERPLGEQVRGRLLQWRAILLGPSQGGLKLAVAGIAVLALVLLFGHGTFRVTAETAIEGSVHRVVAAPFNGYVSEVAVRPGDKVHAGETIARLDDRDLRLERLKALALRDERSNQVRESMANHDRAQSRIASAQLAQTQAQLSLLDEQLSRTLLTAPFDGVIVRGDLSHSLGEAVERGQVLFEVAPLESYRVVLQVDERDIAAVRAGQRGELTLAANPGERLPFTVVAVTPVNSAREGRNVFRVEARLDALPERLRPGMEGVAKIEIGRERLAWIWTRDLANWARLALWSALP